MQSSSPTIETIGQGGLELCFQTHGDPTNEPLLLVMGFTAQMTSWPIGMIEALVERDFFVIVYDNRDVGLSAKSDGAMPDSPALIARARGGEDVSAEAPYTLVDMAADGIGVLDHLGIDTAHVVGASMGGMIVQEMAVAFADRLRSVTSIMSTTGNPEVGEADPDAMAALMAPPPEGRDAAIAHMVKVNQVIGGSLWDEATATARSVDSYDRSFHPPGAAFQLAAIAASGDRTERLSSVTTPFLVLHGRQDSLINMSGALATADAVPGADLVVFDAMGHDLPAPLWPQITAAIEGIAHRSY